jgi:hypothetical protein
MKPKKSVTRAAAAVAAAAAAECATATAPAVAVAGVARSVGSIPTSSQYAR